MRPACNHLLLQVAHGPCDRDWALLTLAHAFFFFLLSMEDIWGQPHPRGSHLQVREPGTDTPTLLSAESTSEACEWRRCYQRPLAQWPHSTRGGVGLGDGQCWDALSKETGEGPPGPTGPLPGSPERRASTKLQPRVT